MADNITIARPYARALFQAACDSGTFDDWTQSLEAFACIIEGLADAKVIGDPKITDAQRFELCFSLIKQAVEVKNDFESELKHFIELILFEKRLIIVPAITSLYHKLVMAHQHVVEAEVVSAAPLSDELKSSLISSLEQKFGSKVAVQYSQDSSLIGGLIIKSDDWVFDGTIRSKLTRLAERII